MKNKADRTLLASKDGFNHMLYAILRHDIIMDYTVTKLTEKFVFFLKRNHLRVHENVFMEL